MKNLTEQFEELQPWYTRFKIGGEEYGGEFSVSEDCTLQAQLLQNYPSPQRVLELGSCEGGRTFPLARRSGFVVAVEGRRQLIQKARFVQNELGAHNISFLELDLEQTDLEIFGQFDVVYNVGFLYTLEDPIRLLEQLTKVSDRMFLWTLVVDKNSTDQLFHYRGKYCVEDHPLGGRGEKSFRPTYESLLQMLKDTGWGCVESVNYDPTDGSFSAWCKKSVFVEDNRHYALVEQPASVSVIVTCHNYGRYLDECLQSIVDQTYQSFEIIIVNDFSTDDTAEIVQRWQACHQGIKCLEVNHQDPRQSRLSGTSVATGDIVCFVDADDNLAPNYLYEGISQFKDYRVGLVYSDIDYFGNTVEHKLNLEATNPLELSRNNFIHVGALVRREALEVTRALEVEVDSTVSHEDWVAWRQVVSGGWHTRKQSGIYYYRQHSQQRSAKKLATPDYYALRATQLDVITIFIPLGREWVWSKLSKWLEDQEWPHSQVRLVLCNTVDSKLFDGTIRDWIHSCDYSDVHYYRQIVGSSELADHDRHQEEVALGMRRAMCRIYNHLAPQITTDFIFVVEDDVLPPLDAAERLLRGFEGHVISVTGVVYSRYHEGCIAWAYNRQIITRPEAEGYNTIEGNGFGCVMVRGEIFREAVFTYTVGPYPDYDPNFYFNQLTGTNLEARICWDCVCEHRGKPDA